MEYDYICELKNVSKTINLTPILSDVSIKIEKGRVTALLGPNGAGKTTTIRLIMNLLKPTEGSIEVFGKDIQASSKLRGKIGLLPQKNSGYKQLTTLENLKFIFELTGIKWDSIQDKLHELFSKLDLEDVLDKKYGKLSGGEARAVSFIRSILTGKDFLILDEPTTGLDLARGIAIRQIILDQIKEGKTVLMSSHVITDLEELAQDIIILKKGRVIATGSKEDIQNMFAPGEKLQKAIIQAFQED